MWLDVRRSRRSPFALQLKPLAQLVAAPSVIQTASEIRPLAELERDYIAAALRASGGNRAKAAQRLGIGAATLYRKLKQEPR